MASVNKVLLIGNLGKDPEVRYTQGGAAVANFSVATNEKWTKDGQAQEKTEWHRIVVWGKTAENCGQYLKKGRSVYIEGRLQTRKWQDKEGRDQYTTEIVAQFVQFLGSKGDGGGSSRGGGDDFGPPPADGGAPPAGGGGGDPGNDDVPF